MNVCFQHSQSFKYLSKNISIKSQSFGFYPTHWPRFVLIYQVHMTVCADKRDMIIRKSHCKAIDGSQVKNYSYYVSFSTVILKWWMYIDQSKCSFTMLKWVQFLRHSLRHLFKYGEYFNPVRLKKLLWIDLFNMMNRSPY